MAKLIYALKARIEKKFSDNPHETQIKQSRCYKAEKPNNSIGVVSHLRYIVERLVCWAPDV